MKTTTNRTNQESDPTGKHTRRRMLTSLAAITLGATAITSGSAQAWSPFSKMVSFGDSLSDTGNFYELTDSPPAPYYDGRASNGKLWNEHLARSLRIPLESADQYAWFGALSGDTNLNSDPGNGILFPGLEQQIEDFLIDHGNAGADPKALYTIWIGANDFLAWFQAQNQTPEQLIMTGVSNTVGGITQLANAGARHFVIGNMPDLGLTPSALQMGPMVAGLLTQLSMTYNVVLAAQLDQLAEKLGISVTPLDAFGILNELATNSEAYRLENVEDAAIDSYPTSDPDDYLFWDAVHPTTKGHRLIANFVMVELIRNYLPARYYRWRPFRPAGFLRNGASRGPRR